MLLVMKFCFQVAFKIKLSDLLSPDQVVRRFMVADEGCPIHPHRNDPFQAYLDRSIRTDR